MNIVFCSCIPRSGSTLLLNLLGQNPIFHITPTNGLSELVTKIRDYWIEDIAFRSQGINKVAPRVRSALHGLIAGFFKQEIYDAKTIIDKSRTWLGYIELLEEMLERRVKIIVPVREIEDVLASFEKIHRRHTLTEPTYVGPLFALRQTTPGRCQSYLAPEAHLGMVIARLRNALECGYRDRLLLVPYRELTRFPRQVANWLTTELGLAKFNYDPDNVKQITEEDDSVYGLDLHRIREGKITPQQQSAWRGILPELFVEWVQREYADINRLATSPLSCTR